MTAQKSFFDTQQQEEIQLWFEEHSVTPPPIDEITQPPVIAIGEIIKFLELKRFHRRIYKYPTYGQLMKEAEKLGAVNRSLEEHNFLRLLETWVVHPNIQHELQLAFMLFDTEERNFLELEELELLVTTHGDHFTADEVSELQRDANMTGDGNVDYRSFVRSMFRIAPELMELPVEYLYSDGDQDPSVPPPTPPPTPPPEPTPPPTPPPPAKKDRKKKKK